MMPGRLNERTWVGQIISWIKDAINSGQTIFQDATNDEGIKLETGATKFPDILLFIDKFAGVVFNGWEIKYPDTPADDRKMLLNSLEKAKKLKANSFVTWNGRQAIIWKIQDKNYRLNSLVRIKTYPPEAGITTREDLAIRSNYLKYESNLKSQLYNILHDLEELYQNKVLKEAINISSNIITAIKDTSDYFIPLFGKVINKLKGDDEEFRRSFNEWKILESATLKILSSSSRCVENVEPEIVLAKQTCYKLIGKILFYLTLSDNLSGKINKLTLTSSTCVKKQLNKFFDQAMKIDYQAIFKKDFTDRIDFNAEIEKVIYELIDVFNEFDFKVLPTEVIGNILENLVPKEEKQKFGQYFTPVNLANLISFAAIKNRNYYVFDPTSGTGTFLSSIYNILKYYQCLSHKKILNQIWGNDISHFPAVLSVINLYKQEINDCANFPRVTREDYFNLYPGKKIPIPDSVDINKLTKLEMPKFDAIVSNFPFIQQEDIPNEILSAKFEKEFNKSQKAFMDGKSFKINERSDYYVYCFYNSLKFLKNGGYSAAITSNAWLGKNYGLQFKKYLLDNFDIQYIVRSNAEHWFKDSKISTVFIVLKKAKENRPAKFVTLNYKLDDYFDEETQDKHMQMIEDFYNEIDHCNNPHNTNWSKDKRFQNVYYKKDKSVRVSLVEKDYLINSLESQENWAMSFIAQNPLSIFKDSLINPFTDLFDVGRGTRTGWDKMHILSTEQVRDFNIENEFIFPVLKTSRDLNGILYNDVPETYLFVCKKPLEELKAKYKHAYEWIKKWEHEKNKKGILLPKTFKNRTPYWYSLTPEEPANLFFPINPDKKLFFAYCEQNIYLNQRFVALRAESKEVELIAALLNSIVSLLIVELNGVSRSLGVLDLNADFFKSKMKILNPGLLGEKEKANIMKKFRVIISRPIQEYTTEFKLPDRIDFDKTVLETFGYNKSLIRQLYEMLGGSVTNRIEMKDR